MPKLATGQGGPRYVGLQWLPFIQPLLYVINRKKPNRAAAIKLVNDLKAAIEALPEPKSPSHPTENQDDDTTVSKTL